MSLKNVIKGGKGDEYYTPKYVVEILLPYLSKTNYKTIWCPFDTNESEYVKVLRENGYQVINSHINMGKDFLNYTPDFHYDIIISNPPFSIKNAIFRQLKTLNTPFAILMSATSLQSASYINLLFDINNIYFIIFDKRISYNGDRPPFPSWYITNGLLNRNEFYIYDTDPKIKYKQWEGKL